MDFNKACFVFCEGKKGKMEMKNYASLPCSVGTRRNREIEIYSRGGARGGRRATALPQGKIEQFVGERHTWGKP